MDEAGLCHLQGRAEAQLRRSRVPGARSGKGSPGQDPTERGVTPGPKSPQREGFHGAAGPPLEGSPGGPQREGSPQGLGAHSWRGCPGAQREGSLRIREPTEGGGHPGAASGLWGGAGLGPREAARSHPFRGASAALQERPVLERRNAVVLEVELPGGGQRRSAHPATAATERRLDSNPAVGGRRRACRERAARECAARGLLGIQGWAARGVLGVVVLPPRGPATRGARSGVRPALAGSHTQRFSDCLQRLVGRGAECADVPVMVQGGAAVERRYIKPVLIKHSPFSIRICKRYLIHR